MFSILVVATTTVYLTTYFSVVNRLSGLIGLVSGGQHDRYDYHRMIFDQPLLTDLLHQAGFREVRRWDWRDTGHCQIDDYSQAYLPHLDKESGRLMSLNLEAVK